MSRIDAIVAILAELDLAVAKHPTWPTDTIHAVAVVCEESGEALQAALNEHYHDGTVADIKKNFATQAQRLYAL